MKFLWSVAWRNLWRHKRRSLITAFAMAIGVALCMSMIAWTDGMYAEMFKVMVEQQLGHVQVHHAAYPGKGLVFDSLEDREALLAEIDGMAGTVAAGPRIDGFALLGGETKSAGGQLIGIDPARHRKVSNVHERMVDGEFLSDDPSKQIIIGYQLAEEIEVGLGDEVVAVTQATDGSTGNDLYTVVGTYKTGDVSMDQFGGFLHIADAEELLYLYDQAHGITVLTEHADDVEAYTLALRAQVSREVPLLVNHDDTGYEYELECPEVVDETVTDEAVDASVDATPDAAAETGKPTITQGTLEAGASMELEDAAGCTLLVDERLRRDLHAESVCVIEGGALDCEAVQVQSWWEASPATAQMMGMSDFTAYFMLAIVFAVAAFGVVNTMMMSVYERTREMGVLRALGLRKGKLVWLVVFESFFLAGLAATIGLAIGGALDWYIVVHGLDFSGSMPDGFSWEGVMLDPVMKGLVRPSSVILPVVAVFVVSILSSLWPAWRATRLQPVTAIREE